MLRHPMPRLRGTVSWAVPRSLPGSLRDRAGTAPAIFFPYDRYVAVVVHVRYQLGTAAGWTAPGRVPRARTAVAPALLGGILATTSPAASGSIFFHLYG